MHTDHKINCKHTACIIAISTSTISEICTVPELDPLGFGILGFHVLLRYVNKENPLNLGGPLRLSFVGATICCTVSMNCFGRFKW